MKNVRNFSFNFHFSSDGEKGTDNAENMKIAAKSHRPKSNFFNFKRHESV